MAIETHPLVHSFSTAVRQVGGAVQTARGGFELAAAIESVVREQSGPRAVLYDPFPLVEQLGLPLALRARGIDMIEVSAAGSRAPELRVGLTGAAIGVADTGSLLVGGRQGGWGLATVLPWVHIAVVDVADLAADSTIAFGRFAERFAAGERDWVWITGPSKTADIAKTLVMGIHGPNRLEVMLVDGGAGR